MKRPSRQGRFCMSAKSHSHRRQEAQAYSPTVNLTPKIHVTPKTCQAPKTVEIPVIRT
jgi:hypothetical protein